MSDKDFSEMSGEEFIAFLIEERESSLDIGSGSRRAYYRKPEERREPNFAEIIHDARFEIVGVGDMPEGEHFWCSFCGNRAKHFVLLRRTSDNSTWKVGKACICRVGLELPKTVRKVVIKRDTKKYKKVEEQPKVEKPKVEETHPGIKKFLEERRKKEDEEFVKEINESVKVEKKPEKKESIEEDEDGYNLDDIFEDEER